MLNSLILLTYHVSSGWKNRNTIYCRQHTIRMSFNKIRLNLIVSRTPLNCYSKKRWTSLVLISGHQTVKTWMQWIIWSGVLCSREYMTVVWTVSMSWTAPRWSLEQSAAINEWRKRLRACVRATEQRFEHLLWARVNDKTYGQIKYK